MARSIEHPAVPESPLTTTETHAARGAFPMLDSATVAAFLLAFLSTAALWWMYFDYVARIAQRRLELAPNRTTLARDAYTYLHVVIVAGVILAAVGDELVIAHPSERLPAEELAAVAGSPALYLVGHALFRLRMTGTVSWRRLGGAACCRAADGIGAAAPAVVVAALIVLVLVSVIEAERIAAARRRARGEPSPLERLEAHAAESGEG